MVLRYLNSGRSGGPANRRADIAIPRAKLQAWLKSYHIQNGVQSNESNTKVVKTFAKGPKHREDTQSGEVSWDGQIVASLLSSHSFYDLSYRRQTKPPKHKQSLGRNNLHPEPGTDSGWWEESDTHVYVCVSLTCVDARMSA